MPKRKRSKKKRKKIKRPYATDKKSRALRRYRRRRHAKSKVQGHHKRAHDEAQMMNYLLNQILKTASAPDETPYNYMPRHYSRDPEYAFSGPAAQDMKKSVPAPDTHFWRPQGENMPPHRGNFPGWEPRWEHTYGHPHMGV